MRTMYDKAVKTTKRPPPPDPYAGMGLSDRQRRVLDAIRESDGGLTGWEIRRFCGETSYQTSLNFINDLVRLGLVCSGGKKVCSLTHRRMTAWKLKEEVA